MNKHRFIKHAIGCGEWLRVDELVLKLIEDGGDLRLPNNAAKAMDNLEDLAKDLSVQPFFVLYPDDGILNKVPTFGVRPPYDVTWLETRLPGGKRIATVAYDDDDGVVFLSIREEEELPGPIQISPDFGYVRIPKEDDGMLYPERWKYSYHSLVSGGIIDREWLLKHGPVWAAGACFHAYVWALLDCKNVKQLEVVSTGRERKRLGKREQKFIYKTLVVTDSKGRVDVDMGSNPDALTATHLVRGHFKTYTEDKPLLGRHIGRFWFPAHVRGSLEAGVVLKDYDVRRTLVH